MRVCKECKLEKQLVDFPLKKNGKVKSSLCKECYNDFYYHQNKEKVVEYKKNYYEENKDKIKEKNKETYHLNKDEINKRRRKNYEENKESFKEKRDEYFNNNKEKINERRRSYHSKNKDIINNRRKEKNRKYALEYYYANKERQNKRSVERRIEKLKTDPFYKLIHNIRCLVRKSLQNQFTTKSKKTIEILGCSFEEFKLHLESQFDDKMNWENQGTYWHMDHIIPISSAKTEEDVYRLNHYTNFQPLYWEDNLKKSNKII
jgi:hypothetical protein